jgi:hypothetical protein
MPWGWTGAVEIISRKEAIDRGLTRYFTGEPCKHGHVAERRTRNGWCIACRQKFRHDRDAANPEAAKKRVKDWMERNTEATIDARRRRKTDPAAIEMELKRFRKSCKRVGTYNPKHRAKRAELNRKRVADELNATPKWLTPEHKSQIADIYEQAALATQLTGVTHHVDHIEPLRGKDRIGLHVPWNLQILTASENSSKGNRPVQHFHWKKV